jgi:hypothetical protein
MCNYLTRVVPHCSCSPSRSQVAVAYSFTRRCLPAIFETLHGAQQDQQGERAAVTADMTSPFATE